MSINEIKSYKLEKHDTKDIHDKHINGFLIPVWRDWDKTITVQPKMVYMTTINPGEIILSGSFIRPIEARKGDKFLADFGDFGMVDCRFE